MNISSEERKVWRYQRGIHKLYIDEGQTTQRPKEKGQTMMYKTQYRKHKIEQHKSL